MLQPCQPSDPLDSFTTFSTLWPLVMHGEAMPMLRLGDAAQMQCLMQGFLARLHKEWFPLRTVTIADAPERRHYVPIAHRSAVDLLSRNAPALNGLTIIKEGDPLLLLAEWRSEDDLARQFDALPMLLRWLGNATGNPFLDAPSPITGYLWERATLHHLRDKWQRASDTLAAMTTFCDRLAATPAVQEPLSILLRRLQLRAAFSDEYGYQQAA